MIITLINIVEQILQNSHIMLTAMEAKHRLDYISVLHRISGFPICRSETVSRKTFISVAPRGLVYSEPGHMLPE